MSEEIERVIAKSEIYDLSCKYMRGLDRLDIELLKSVFHEGAWCDYGFTCLLYTSPSPRD